MIILLIGILCIMSYSLGEEWTIHVYTGTERFAGTDNNIFIRLHDSKHGYSREFELNHNNWIFGHYEFPLKNLFEYGAHDRFRISTEKIKTVATIHVRHESFPLLRSDWFLDRIVAERNRDSTTFTFPCSCWFRKERSDITIPVLTDIRSLKKSDPLENNSTIVIVLIISVVLITCFACCSHACCRLQSFRSVSSQQNSSIFNRYPSLSPELPLLYDTISPWRNIPSSLLSHNDVSVAIVRPTTVISTDEPPAYSDLFPN